MGLIAAVLCAPFIRVVGMGDEGVLLNGAERMLRGSRLYADFFEYLPPGGFRPHRGMVQHSRNLGWVRAVASDLDHRRDRLFHLPRLLAGIQERPALRSSRDGVGGDVAGRLDA